MATEQELYIKLSKERFDKLFHFKNNKGYNTVKATYLGKTVYFVEVAEYRKILDSDPVDDYINPWTLESSRDRDRDPFI